jgi:ABC-type nickel/cobalt efflux system permease component RcnA
MAYGQQLLLLAAVVGVGFLHTLVPDHWAPIALIARQRGWTRGETARAAAGAGLGHTVTTLAFGLAVWLVGAAAVERFGATVDLAASAALIGFGAWIAIGAWREVREERHGHAHGHGHGHGHSHAHGQDHDHGHGPDGHGGAGDAQAWTNDPLFVATRGVAVHARHSHVHTHGGHTHSHWHDHTATSAHAVTAETMLSPPAHLHRHRTTGRLALLLVLGSSPMVEGIPAFFAASRYGFGLIAAMGALFALSTIATYVALSVSAAAGLKRLNLGPIERYGEVISGAFIVVIGVAFGAWSLI